MGVKTWGVSCRKEMPLLSRSASLQVRSPRDPDAVIPFTGYRIFEHTDTHSEREKRWDGDTDRQTDRQRERQRWRQIHPSACFFLRYEEVAGSSDP